METLTIIGAFTHWLYNAKSDFIKEAWKGNHLAKHFQDKLEGAIAKSGYMSLDVLIRFHQELDTKNREILYKYIMENHTKKWNSKY